MMLSGLSHRQMRILVQGYPAVAPHHDSPDHSSHQWGTNVIGTRPVTVVHYWCPVTLPSSYDYQYNVRTVERDFLFLTTTTSDETLYL